MSDNDPWFTKAWYDAYQEWAKAKDDFVKLDSMKKTVFSSMVLEKGDVSRTKAVDLVHVSEGWINYVKSVNDAEFLMVDAKGKLDHLEKLRWDRHAEEGTRRKEMGL